MSRRMMEFVLMVGNAPYTAQKSTKIANRATSCEKKIVSPVRPPYFQLKGRLRSEVVAFQTGAGVAPVDFLLVQNKLAPAASVGISIVEGEIK